MTVTSFLYAPLMMYPVAFNEVLVFFLIAVS